jgi:alpha-glucosidase
MRYVERTNTLIDTAWWKRGIIYQIYPRSFQDSNGDGVGDLNGMRRRLDYLTWLGIDAIWISPIYPSPMADFGYDITDYCNIDPVFGTLADFDALLHEADQRGVKVILDFVPNHTSDHHPWFMESRSSQGNAKRDWYIWRDGKPDGGPPNNWISQFGGSAWTIDARTNQYYLHSFLVHQPDLNWRNPDVRAAMFNVLRFWLDRGVDGFRVDVLWLLIKDAMFRDNPPNPNYRANQPAIDRYLSLYNADQPEIHDVVAEMRSVLDSYTERVLIGEIYLPFNRLALYYGKNLEGVQLPFNFALIHAAWNAKEIGGLIADYEAALPPDGWPNWVLGNHDQPATREQPQCCYSRCAVLPPCITATRLAWRGSRFRKIWCRIPGKKMNLDLALAAIPGGRHCSGMSLKARASQPRRRGCRSIKIFVATTLPCSSASRVHYFAFITA